MRIRSTPPLAPVRAVMAICLVCVCVYFLRRHVVSFPLSGARASALVFSCGGLIFTMAASTPCANECEPRRCTTMRATNAEPVHTKIQFSGIALLVRCPETVVVESSANRTSRRPCTNTNTNAPTRTHARTRTRERAPVLSCECARSCVRFTLGPCARAQRDHTGPDRVLDSRKVVCLSIFSRFCASGAAATAAAAHSDTAASIERARSARRAHLGHLRMSIYERTATRRARALLWRWWCW